MIRDQSRRLRSEVERRVTEFIDGVHRRASVYQEFGPFAVTASRRNVSLNNFGNLSRSCASVNKHTKYISTYTRRCCYV